MNLVRFDEHRFHEDEYDCVVEAIRRRVVLATLGFDPPRYTHEHLNVTGAWGGSVSVTTSSADAQARARTDLAAAGYAVSPAGAGRPGLVVDGWDFDRLADRARRAARAVAEQEHTQTRQLGAAVEIYHQELAAGTEPPTARQVVQTHLAVAARDSQDDRVGGRAISCDAVSGLEDTAVGEGGVLAEWVYGIALLEQAAERVAAARLSILAEVLDDADRLHTAGRQFVAADLIAGGRDTIRALSEQGMRGEPIRQVLADERLLDQARRNNHTRLIADQQRQPHTVTDATVTDATVTDATVTDATEPDAIGETEDLDDEAGLHEWLFDGPDADQTKAQDHGHGRDESHGQGEDDARRDDTGERTGERFHRHIARIQRGLHSHTAEQAAQEQARRERLARWRTDDTSSHHHDHRPPAEHGGDDAPGWENS